MKEKFTQGDWAVSGDDCCAVFSGLELVVDCGISSLNGGEDVSNALLIAAAPEMYRLLEEFSNMVMPTAGELYQKCDEAMLLLAKARGDNA